MNPGSGQRPGGPKKESRAGDKIETSKPVVVAKPQAKPELKPPTLTDAIPKEVLSDLMDQIRASLVQKREDRPRVDRSKVRCYRCQEMGHYASECQADKPVYRKVSALEVSDGEEN